MLADAALAHEQAIRLAAFFLVFAGLALWEALAPRRVLTLPKARRWKNNLALLLINSIMVRALFPAAAVGFAAFAESQSLGLLHIWPWRLHRVHHADPDFDVTTGTRFHPVEILLSMGIKFLVIIALGPVLAVLIFETLLNVTAMFNHSNIRLPGGLDNRIRTLLVTPDMHRVHHSVERVETHSNFGFCFSAWDRLFGTYQAAPRLGQIAMQVGVAEVHDPRQVVDLKGLLALPFDSAERSWASSSSLR